MTDKKGEGFPIGKNFGGGSGLRGVVEKPKDFQGTFRRLTGYLLPHKQALFLVLFMAIAGSIFGVLSPKIMGLATTEIFSGFLSRRSGQGTGIDFIYIGNIIGILATLYLVSAAFVYIMQYVLAGVSQNIVYQIRDEVNGKLGRLPVSYFDTHSQGDIMSRAANDVDTIGSTLSQSISQLVTAIISVVGIVVMMLVISPLLAAGALLTLPVSVWVTKTIVGRSQDYYRTQQQSLGRLNGHIEEMYTAHMVVKAYGYEKKSLDTFQELNQSLYDSGWRAQFLSGMIMPLMGFINNLGYVFIAVAGALMIAQGRIPIGDVQAMIQYTRQLSHPIIQVANISNILQSTMAASERIFELLDAQEEGETGDKETIFKKGQIIFDQVGFSYEPGKEIIRDFSLSVEPGQTVAIVGATGSGKTTLVNLLMRFYEIDQGRILIDGVDIRLLTREAVRKTFGMVLQDTWLFQGSLLENIRFGRPSAPPEEVLKAGEMASLHTFVPCLEEGYETQVDEEASNISRGQKQLVTIARAFISNPPILILDEATSNVDTRTEVHIQRAMKRLMKGRTNIVIAHRISTIQDADMIVVMDKGRLLEKGRHQELLEKKGAYYELFQSQFTGLREL